MVQREQVREDLLISQTEEILTSQGYKLIEDAWDEFGRRTCLHDDDANRDYIKELARLLRGPGWQVDAGKLRTFCHPARSPTSLHHSRRNRALLAKAGYALEHLQITFGYKRFDRHATWQRSIMAGNQGDFDAWCASEDTILSATGGTSVLR
jgi:hypothetical protein